MRTRRILAVVLVLMIGITAVWSSAADAKDAKGCEGLADYRAATFKAGRDFMASLEKDGISYSRDMLTFSSDDWSAFADDAIESQRALKKITPPSWAAAYHEDLIAQAGLQQQIATAAATGGVMATIAFTQPANDLDAKVKADIAAISSVCADFAAFARDHDALDGDIDGTPVATPTD